MITHFFPFFLSGGATTQKWESVFTPTGIDTNVKEFIIPLRKLKLLCKNAWMMGRHLKQDHLFTARKKGENAGGRRKEEFYRLELAKSKGKHAGIASWLSYWARRGQREPVYCITHLHKKPKHNLPFSLHKRDTAYLPTLRLGHPTLGWCVFYSEAEAAQRATPSSTDTREPNKGLSDDCLGKHA